LDTDLEWTNSGKHWLPSSENCSSEKKIMYHNFKWQCKLKSSAHRIKHT
jgi:hypothetical protein